MEIVPTGMRGTNGSTEEAKFLPAHVHYMIPDLQGLEAQPS